MTLSVPSLALRRAFDSAVEEAISSRAGWSDLAAREVAEERGRDAARAYRAGELRRARVALGDCIRAEQNYRSGPSRWQAVADLIGGVAAPDPVPSRQPIYAMRAAPKALRPCAICKSEFKPVQENARYCGDACRAEADRRRVGERVNRRQAAEGRAVKPRTPRAPGQLRGEKTTKPLKMCRGCGVQFRKGEGEDGYSGYWYCSRKCAQGAGVVSVGWVPVPVSCPWCKTQHTPDHPSSLYCGDACRSSMKGHMERVRYARRAKGAASATPGSV